LILITLQKLDTWTDCWTESSRRLACSKDCVSVSSMSLTLKN